MTTEKTNQKNEHEEKCATMDCCSPQRFVEMMDKCGEDMKSKCRAMMQEMMKGGCYQSEQK
jgi:hypothetical protein